jgi:hypothetical protein
MRKANPISRGADKVDRRVEAEVVGVRIGSGRALLRAAERAQPFEASAPDEIARHLEPGARVMLFLDGDEELVGWYLPERHLGVREDRPG